MKTRNEEHAICSGCGEGKPELDGMMFTASKTYCDACLSEPQYTPKQHRQAQDLAVQLGHLNKGIPSLIDLYAAAPELLEACKTSVCPNEKCAHGKCHKFRKVIAKAEGK